MKNLGNVADSTPNPQAKFYSDMSRKNQLDFTFKEGRRYK